MLRRPPLLAAASVISLITLHDMYLMCKSIDYTFFSRERKYSQ